MEVPGVEKKDIEINLENDVLRVEGRIDFGKYEGFEPLYTEYNVGQISAQLEHGLLRLTLQKAAEARPRQIAIN